MNGPNSPAPNTLEVFVGNSDSNKIFSATQASANSTTWGPFGQIATAPNKIQKIVVGVNDSSAPNPNTLEIFVLGSDNHIYSNTQQSAGGAWGGFGDINYSNNYPTNTFYDIAVNKNSNGTLEVFALGGDNNVYSDTQASPGGTWNGVGLIGAVPIGGLLPKGTEIQVQLDPSGNVELFVLGSDDMVYTASRGASGWATFTGGAGGPSHRVSQMVVGRNQDGTPEIFDIQFNTTSPDVIWSETQNATGGWNGFSQIIITPTGGQG
jgi:hypothetical protein